MRKLTIINPVIFVIIFIVAFVLPGNINAQGSKTCPGGGHKNDDNVIEGKVSIYTSKDSPDTTFVSQGMVKLLRVNPPSLEVIAVDSAHINSSGFYRITEVPQGSYYIVAYPGDKVEDFMISFYPSGQLWNTASRINLNQNQGQVTICNIQSVPMYQTSGGTPVSGEIADSANHNYKLRNSIIIAKSGNEYRGFAITNNQGKYLVNSILPGNYNITATRFGFRNTTQNLTITSAPAVVNFYMGNDPSYTISVNENETVVKDFKLHQNYPNPFNPSTQISFNLDKAMEVKLGVYSIDGKFIKELTSGYKPAGEYRFNFNGENLSSGIYNYVLETGTGQRESKLMVFTK